LSREREATVLPTPCRLLARGAEGNKSVINGAG
jgi:hypothetical protein